ncbi:apovitellenin-1 [Xenopus laevis]|uniref:Apovitellenin-1 n=1 Tax=Xenopus laevis TaxID=8355 RepID=A0A8J0U4H1_XENLA|nr:apovitellenin-1 [Xenopus laevis]
MEEGSRVKEVQQLPGTTFLLILLSLEIGAKSIRKRHVRRDWLIIPDTIAFCIYGSVNDLYLPAGKLLMDIFETPVVQNTRSFIIDVTSQLTLKGEELQSKIADFWKEISASQN